MSLTCPMNAEPRRDRRSLVGRPVAKPEKGNAAPRGKAPFHWLKYVLTRVGARCSPRIIHNLNALTNYLEVGRWLREHNLEPAKRCRTREQLFDLLAGRFADDAVLFLEFGVSWGNSLRYWCSLLRNADSRLHGFDSFEGLPEARTPVLKEGYYSTGGEIPQIADPRVRCFKGLFQETLPRYVAPPHDVAMISIDCDLYSSTIYVLNSVAPLMAPGTYLHFGSFDERHHVLRAFDQFLRHGGMQFEVVGATRTLAEIAFRRIA